jgi:sec-independent protein translocase protein TatA
MGLFGLGVPEVAVIAGVVALVFGEYPTPACAWVQAADMPPLAAPPPPPPPPPPLPLLSLCASTTCQPAGPSKLPELGKGLGKTVKNFQSAAKVRGCAGPEPAAGKSASPEPACRRPVDGAPSRAVHCWGGRLALFHSYMALYPTVILRNIAMHLLVGIDPHCLLSCLQEFEKELKDATADEAAPEQPKAVADKKDSPPSP